LRTPANGSYPHAAGRTQNLDALHQRLSQWTRDFDDYELAKRLRQRGVAAAPVLNVADLLKDSHYRARGTFIEVRHPLGFEETIYGPYVKNSRTEPDLKTGPAMGRDNDHVFKELLEIPESRYRQLIDDQIIY
jgi:benzylsuccinate CoA-transferase BbsF subunit